ncbi:MAG: hypothetical protein ACKOB5_04935, partial [Betaproteobacteria bacterium]
MRWRVGWTLCSLGLLAVLLGCGSNPRPAQPAAQTVPSGAQAPRTATGPAAPGAMAGGSLASERAERRGAVWVRVNWDELPGFQQDTVGEVLPALRASCPRAGAAWRVACEQAAR